MLVLTRRVGEEIIIGENIRVKIVSIKGDRIRVGIEAPNNVSVDRAEIHSRRLEFQAVLDIPLANNSRFVGEDHHCDADVPLGVMPASCDMAEETMVH